MHRALVRTCSRHIAAKIRWGKNKTTYNNDGKAESQLDATTTVY